jgi:hypothetical protein
MMHPPNVTLRREKIHGMILDASQIFVNSFEPSKCECSLLYLCERSNLFFLPQMPDHVVIFKVVIAYLPTKILLHQTNATDTEKDFDQSQRK